MKEARGLWVLLPAMLLAAACVIGFFVAKAVL